MTNKLIEFTPEIKSLIWSTKVQPASGTDVEAKAFVEVCEEYGLNPLLGDITFQRYEGKYGPKVSYLISRDAYLKFAMRQEDFKNILSGVVKEGDEFRLDIVEGVPHHSFGAKRGNILGAWCVVKTKNRGNTLVFADFQEYQKALSPKNPLWNSMPSAMIEKVAHTMALRRIFPLGVTFASEEEVGFDSTATIPNNDEQSKNESASLVSDLEEARKQKEESKKEANKKAETKIKKEKPQPPVVTVEPTKSVESKVEQKQEENPEKEKQEDPQVVVQQNKQQPITDDKEEPKNLDTTLANLFVLEQVEMGVSGNNNKKFLRVLANNNGVPTLMFVEEENIEVFNLFDELTPGAKFEVEQENRNGFAFIQTVKVA